MWWQPASITCLLTCCSVCWYRLHIPLGSDAPLTRMLPCCGMNVMSSQKYIQLIIIKYISFFLFLLCFLLTDCYTAITPSFLILCPDRWQIHIHSFVTDQQFGFTAEVKIKKNRVKQRLVLDYFYYKIITEGVIILKWGFNKCFPEQALMAVINLLTCSSQTSAQLPRSCVWKLCVLHVDTYCITE